MASPRDLTKPDILGKKSLAYRHISGLVARLLCFGGHFRLENGHRASCTWHLFESPCEVGLGHGRVWHSLTPAA